MTVRTGARSAPAADSTEQVSQMARSGGLSIAGAGVSAVAGIALAALITNGLSQTEAGTVFATTAVFLIATSFVQLGTEVGVVRWLPGLLVRSEPHHVRHVLRTALVPVLTAAALVATAGWVLARPLAGVIASDASSDLVTTEIRVLAVALPLTAVYNVLLAATRGLRTMVPTVAVESLGRSVAQLVGVAAVQLLSLGAVAVVVAYSVPYALALVAVVVWLGVLMRRSPSAPSPVPGAAAAAVAGFWRFTGPRAIGTTSQMLLKRSDIVLVAALRSPREAALYAAASRFVAIGQLGVQALQQALSPQLAALFAGDDHDVARDVYRATTAWSMLLAWPSYLVCAVLAPELLRLFGSGYGEVAGVAIVLSLAMLVSTGCGAVDAVLLMSGHAWLSLSNSLLALAVNVGANLLLIPKLGVMGAGLAWALAILVRNLLPLYQVSRMYGISPVGRETATVAAAALTCFGAVPFAVRLLTSTALPVVVALGLGAVAYLALVWRFRAPLRLGAFRGALRRRRRPAPA